MVDHNGAWLRALPVDNGRWRLRADLKRTDPDYIRHLLKIEDERFYWHPGVDATAVLRALLSNLHMGHIVSGGSTITMQTARLLSPHPRDYGNKAVEALRALQLELRYTKPQILGFYLSLAPYGGNLEGVRAASLSYFGHEPESLTLGEQALLISMPQAPEARRPDRHPNRARLARDRILTRMKDAHTIDDIAAREAMAEPLPARRNPFPGIGVARGRAVGAPGKRLAGHRRLLDRRQSAKAAGIARHRHGDCPGRRYLRRYPGRRYQDARRARQHRLGRTYAYRRLGRHDPRPQIAGLEPETLHLRHRL